MSYRDKFYSKYVSTHTSHLYRETSLDDIKKQFSVWRKYFGRFLPKDKSAKIIDLGCGKGDFVYWFHQIGYLNAEGIDVSGEQVGVAKKLGIKNIQQADIKEFFKNKRDFYDVIFMRDVLEHFNKEEILSILEIIFNSFKNNGFIILQVPNAEGPFGNRYRYSDFTHEIAFTESSARQVLLSCGFKKVKIYSQPPVIRGIKSFIRFILWKCIECCLRFYLLIETGSAKGIFTQNLIAVAKK